MSVGSQYSDQTEKQVFDKSSVMGCCVMGIS